MSDFKAQMDELNTLASDLGRAASGRVGGLAAAVVRKSAADIERDAKTFCPVDTGNLRNSISTNITGDGRFRAVRAEVGPTASYGAYVEFGTSRTAPQAFMGPALDRNGWAFEKAMGQIADRLAEDL